MVSAVVWVWTYTFTLLADFPDLFLCPPPCLGVTSAIKISKVAARLPPSLRPGQEFYEAQNPFPLSTVVRISGLLNRLAFRLLATSETIRVNASSEVLPLRLSYREVLGW
jgi:hypothetical protein